MDEQKQFQDEYEQRLAEALEQVEKGNVTEDYMVIIRHACGLPKAELKKLISSIFK